MLCLNVIFIHDCRAEQQKFTVRVSKDAFPETVVGEAVSKKSKSLRVTREQQIQLIEEHQKNYVLKVCGSQEYLLERYPICQYKVNHISFLFFIQIFFTQSKKLALLLIICSSVDLSDIVLI